MKAFLFTLAILCAVQTARAFPRPDFAINGDVANSDKTLAAGDLLETEFEKAGAKDVTLVAGYGLLATLRTKLQAIGDAVTTAGDDLANQLQFLAMDDLGTIALVYDDTNTKIASLKTLITTGLTADIAAITALVGDDIEVQFTDGFEEMVPVLETLKTKLATLRSNVETARGFAGSAAVVPAATIKKYVPAKSVTDVTSAIRSLRAAIPLITYVVDSSLDNVKLADDFIVDIETEARRAKTEYDTSVTAYQDSLDEIETETSNLATTTIGDDVPTLLTDIQADLDASAGYASSDLVTDIGDLDTATSDTLVAATTAFDTSFTTYSNNVPNLIPDLDADMGDALCDSVEAVSLALVANGPYSDFCFSKYSPRVYALVSLTINAFDMCFEREKQQLAYLQELVQLIVIQISYNTEDLFDNLSACLATEDPDETDCFTAIQPYYHELVTATNDHISSLESVVDAETLASYNRLGACLTTSLFVTILQGLEIITDVEGCVDSGPGA